MVGTGDLGSMAAGLIGGDKELAGRLLVWVLVTAAGTGGAVDAEISVRLSGNRPDVVFSRRCNSSVLKRATPLRPCAMTCFGV